MLPHRFRVPVLLFLRDEVAALQDTPDAFGDSYALAIARPESFWHERVAQTADGIVIIDPVKSKGRKDLVESCPHGQIWWNEELQLPQKWIFDAHLLLLDPSTLDLAPRAREVLDVVGADQVVGAQFRVQGQQRSVQ
mgnify:CR=1 FL=1